MTDTSFGHDRDGDGGFDFFDELRVGHTSNAALSADVGGDTLQGHDGASAGFFSDTSLFGVDDVHDDTAAEHLSEADFDGEWGGFGGGGGCFGECTVAVDGYDSRSFHGEG